MACTELFESTLMIWDLAEELINPWSSFFYFVDKNIDNTLSEASFMFTDTMTVGMSLERVLALWAPLKYRTLDHWFHFKVIRLHLSGKINPLGNTPRVSAFLSHTRQSREKS